MRNVQITSSKALGSQHADNSQINTLMLLIIFQGFLFSCVLVLRKKLIFLTANSNIGFTHFLNFRCSSVLFCCSDCGNLHLQSSNKSLLLIRHSVCLLKALEI